MKRRWGNPFQSGFCSSPAAGWRTGLAKMPGLANDSRQVECETCAISRQGSGGVARAVDGSCQLWQLADAGAPPGHPIFGGSLRGFQCERLSRALGIGPEGHVRQVKQSGAKFRGSFSVFVGRNSSSARRALWKPRFSGSLRRREARARMRLAGVAARKPMSVRRLMRPRYFPSNRGESRCGLTGSDWGAKSKTIGSEPGAVGKLRAELCPWPKAGGKIGAKFGEQGSEQGREGTKILRSSGKELSAGLPGGRNIDLRKLLPAIIRIGAKLANLLECDCNCVNYWRKAGLLVGQRFSERRDYLYRRPPASVIDQIKSRLRSTTKKTSNPEHIQQGAV